MKRFEGLYTPMKWEDGEEVPNCANAKPVTIVKIVEPTLGVETRVFRVVFIDPDGKLGVDTMNCFSECK